MKRLIFATLALFMALPASAEFVEHDWKVEGDALATFDSDTGLEWLDLSETRSMSIDEVNQLTQSGQIFDGWRLPTYTEIQSLASRVFTGVNTSRTYSRDSSFLTDGMIEQFSMFGANGYSNSLLIGMYQSNDGYARMMGYVYYDDFYYNHLRSYSTDWSVSHDGVFLVSDGGVTLTSKNNQQSTTEVSAPALGMLMSAGLFLLIGFRRRHL